MENEIRDFFRQTAPKPTDATSFTLELNARLAAVEQIKAYHDREIRRTRRILYIVFAAGLLLGGAFAAILILHPVKLPELNAPESAGLGSWFWGIAAIIVLLAVSLPILLSRRHRMPLLRY